MAAVTDGQVEILADALAATGAQLWKMSLNNTVAADRVFQWMRVVAPGQLVLEITNIRSPAIDTVGELLAIEGSSEYERIYTIRTLDGREVRWDNAEFVRIPRNAADSRELAQQKLEGVSP